MQTVGCPFRIICQAFQWSKGKMTQYILVNSITYCINYYTCTCSCLPICLFMTANFSTHITVVLFSSACSNFPHSSNGARRPVSLSSSFLVHWGLDIPSNTNLSRVPSLICLTHFSEVVFTLQFCLKCHHFLHVVSTLRYQEEIL